MHAPSTTVAGPLPSSASTHRRGWLHVFLTGLALWVLTVIVTMVTENTNLVPAIVLLGSFLVPVTYVAWVAGHRGAEMSFELVAQAFMVGGVIGVLAASLLESYLLSPSPFIFLGVGLIEEAVKVLALMLVVRKFPARTLRNGLILGATVGFGFAAFESAGYAFNAVLTVQGLSLRDLVETEVLRGVLTPFGHGLWTAILGGVLFAATRNGRWRLTLGLLGAYLGVSLLHALWDSMHGLAIAVTVALTRTPLQVGMWERGYLPHPTPAQVHLATALDWAGLIVISVIALIWLANLRGKVRTGR